MTSQRTDAAAIRHLLEEFVEVGDRDDVDTEPMQRRSARLWLPGPTRGAYSLQQLTLISMSPPVFQAFRRAVRDWLRALTTDPRVGHWRTLAGPLRVALVADRQRPDRLVQPLIEGPALDVCWYYLLLLVSRVGVSQIGVCHAPRSRREAESEWEFCGRLFVRRGSAKAFCSDRCRARVATQRARGGPRIR
jgi:hypothetical protein